MQQRPAKAAQSLESCASSQHARSSTQHSEGKTIASPAQSRRKLRNNLVLGGTLERIAQSLSWWTDRPSRNNASAMQQASTNSSSWPISFVSNSSAPKSFPRKLASSTAEICRPSRQSKTKGTRFVSQRANANRARCSSKYTEGLWTSTWSAKENTTSVPWHHIQIMQSHVAARQTKGKMQLRHARLLLRPSSDCTMDRCRILNSPGIWKPWGDATSASSSKVKVFLTAEQAYRAPLLAHSQRVDAFRL